MLDVAVVSFSQARTALRKICVPSAADAMDVMHTLLGKLTSAAILAELDPEALPATINIGEQEDTLIDAALDAIDDVAPIDQDFMVMTLEEMGGADLLFPLPAGFAMGWDEWNNSINENFKDCGNNMGLFILITALRMLDNDALWKAVFAFGWDVETNDLDGIHDFDWKKIDELLEKAGLDCFKNAINICLYSTGNLYFDFNPYDEEPAIDMLPPYSLKGMRYLREKWQEAQPILADYKQSEELFVKNPGMPQKIVDVFMAAAIPVHRRPQTLVEMWAAPEDVERVIDPFYGPLDGGDEEEESGGD